MAQDVYVTVSGILGKMGNIIAQGVVLDKPGSNFKLLDASMEADVEQSEWVLHYRKVVGTQKRVRLVKPEQHPELFDWFYQEFCGERTKSLIAVDFVKDTAGANEPAMKNAELYCEKGVDFIMGSTGIDYAKVRSMVESAGVVAVVAPNFDASIVAYMDQLKFLADNYPGLYNGKRAIQFWESHQENKDGTSGTMKSMVENYNKLGLLNKFGVPISLEDITSIRMPKMQQQFLNVPEEWIGWHAYHTVVIANEDGSIADEVRFRRHGGESYRLGVDIALNFIMNKRAEGVEGKMYSAMDMFKSR